MINDNYSRLHVASNQILLNFSRMKSLGEPATKLEMAGQRRPQDPPQRVGRFELLVRRACVHPFIDTPSGSPNIHYVKSSGQVNGDGPAVSDTGAKRPAQFDWF